VKQLAQVLGIVFGCLGFLAIQSMSPNHNADVKADVFAAVAFFLCVVLIWYGTRKRSANK